METVTQIKMNDNFKLDLKSANSFDLTSKIKFSLVNTKVKLEFKEELYKRGRMKVTMKFGSDEALGFTNFCKLAKPENMSQDDFVKFLFYKGVEALQKDFAAKVEEFRINNPDEYAKLKSESESLLSPEEGSVTIAEDKP
jgi:hypothetical protein